MRTLLAAVALLATAACGVESADPSAEPTPTLTYVDPQHPARAFLSVEVPGVCDYAPTRLVRGTAYDGNVRVDAPMMRVTGPILDGVGGSVMVVQCVTGAVGTPNVLAFYDADLELVGSLDLYDVTAGGREYVQELSVQDGLVRVLVGGIGDADDPGCCGSRAARLLIGWDAGRPVVEEKEMFDGLTDVQRLLEAADAGDRELGLELATEKVYDSLVAHIVRGVVLEATDCAANADQTFPHAGKDAWMCGVAGLGPHGEEWNDGLLMTPRDAGGWRVVARTVVAG